MITSSSVYEVLLDISRKDLRGRSLTPEEFNNTAKLVNELVFQKYYSKFEETLDNSETMSAFKVLNEAIPIVAGVGSLPARYFHVVGKPRYVDTGGVTRHLDLVSSFEDAVREDDYLTKASLTYPTYRLGIASTNAAMTIHVRPTTGINPIYLDYIRTPNVPFLDYYINDTTLNYTWMTAGALNVSIPAGSTTRDGRIGPIVVVSYTVNFEWNADDLPLIINLFLKYMGIQLPSPELFEGGTLLETKQDEK